MADLERWMTGKIEPKTMRTISAFYLASTLYDRHIEDAVELVRDERERAAKEKVKEGQ